MLSRIRLEARRFVGAVVAEGFFSGASRLARLHPRAKPHRHAVEHIADVPYLDGSKLREHLLDVWRPAEAPLASSSIFAQRHRGPPWPIVFYVHGGGFRILSKDTHWVMALGTKDPLLPDTRRLAEALRKLGVEAVESYYPGELHAFHAFVMRSAARRCWSDTFRFLDRHVPAAGPHGQPTVSP